MAIEQVLIKRILRGCEWLDRARPGWDQVIDVEMLHLRSGDQCVIGQLFGNYSKFPYRDQTAISLGFMLPSSISSVWGKVYSDSARARHEHAWETLNEKWRGIIIARKEIGTIQRRKSVAGMGLLDRVQAGMEWLDAYFDGDDWVQCIDLDTLDLSDSNECIIGQTMGDYCHFPGDEAQSVQNGFSIRKAQTMIQGYEYNTPFGVARIRSTYVYSATKAQKSYAKLTAAWKRAIQARRTPVSL